MSKLERIQQEILDIKWHMDILYESLGEQVSPLALSMGLDACEDVFKAIQKIIDEE